MKIGLDIHGCIDLYPEIFSDMSWSLKKEGHRVYIITGQEYEKVSPKIEKYHIGCDEIFSIVDYHKGMNTQPMWKGLDGTWWMKDDVWVRTKGDFIKREGIDVHFDDSVEYAKYIPDTCTFVLVPKTGFVTFALNLLR